MARLAVLRSYAEQQRVGKSNRAEVRDFVIGGILLLLPCLAFALPWKLVASFGNTSLVGTSGGMKFKRPSQETVLEQQGLLANKKNVCQGYEGILFISQGDDEASADAFFFQSIVNQLIYADLYNLYPWLHVDPSANLSVFDPQVHGHTPTHHNISFIHTAGTVRNIKGTGGMVCKATFDGTYPGPPDYHYRLKEKQFQLEGNGLWESYFRPISPHPIQCDKKLPIFEMSKRQIMPDLDRCSDYAVRVWPFEGMPPKVTPGPLLQDWFGDSRERGAGVVQKYFELAPWIQQEVEKKASPDICLAVCISKKDRQEERSKIFGTYANAFAEATNSEKPIVVSASDTAAKMLFDSLPLGYPSSMLILPSDGEVSVHWRNTNTLVNIYTMAQCQFLLHDTSMSGEAVVYVSPHLHSRSVNVDMDQRMTPEDFGNIVRRYMLVAETATHGE